MLDKHYSRHVYFRVHTCPLDVTVLYFSRFICVYSCILCDVSMYKLHVSLTMHRR